MAKVIYTVTFNPSMDYIVSVDDFELGMTNRTTHELMSPGGKGINVSIALKNLGLNSTAIGFIAGFVGEEIRSCLEKMGMNTGFIKIEEGCSRVNVKLKNIDGTEINGCGPHISKEKAEELFDKLADLKDGDILVLAGSIPGSMSDQTYRRIMERLKEKDITVVVDATSTLLMNVLEYNPFLIKPNHHELGEVFDTTISTREEILPYARKLQDLGARNVLVSMGGKGAVLVAEDGTAYEADAPEGILKNSVGSGDSMVAGFIKGWLDGLGYEHAFRMGVATGSASAFSDNLATKAEVEEVLARVVSNKINI